MARSTSFALAAALAVAAPSVALATPTAPTAAELDRAADLFKKAKALHASGKLQAAMELYTQAWTLHRSPDIAANLAACELALRRYRDAAEHFDFALRHMLAQTTAEQKARLTEGLEKARAEIATVQLEIEPAGAVVEIDGTLIEAAQAFVEPGERKLRVSKDGFEPYVGGFVVGKGQSKTVRVALEAKVAPSSAAPPGSSSSEARAPRSSGDSRSAPAETERDATRPRRSAVPAYVALGAGVVGLGAGVGLLLAASGKDEDRDALLAEIPGTNKCGQGTVAPDKCARVASLSDDAQQLRTFGYVSFGIAAAGGALAFLLWPRSSGPTGAAVVVPSVGPDGSSVHLQGSF